MTEQRRMGTKTSCTLLSYLNETAQKPPDVGHNDGISAECWLPDGMRHTFLKGCSWNINLSKSSMLRDIASISFHLHAHLSLQTQTKNTHTHTTIVRGGLPQAPDRLFDVLPCPLESEVGCTKTLLGLLGTWSLSELRMTLLYTFVSLIFVFTMLTWQGNAATSVATHFGEAMQLWVRGEVPKQGAAMMAVVHKGGARMAVVQKGATMMAVVQR